jgi:hypothetical protein
MRPTPIRSSSVLQASDAAGKDGTIKHVMSGVNPQGSRCSRSRSRRARSSTCSSSASTQSSWADCRERIEARISGRLATTTSTPSSATSQRHAGFAVFLNVSKKEQRKRFLERRDRPEKNWKFSFGDLEERKHWSEYREAFEQMVQNTSTRWAPWWVIPADHKWVTRTLVASIITRSINGLGVAFPEVSEKDRRRLAAARSQLLEEK